MKNNTILAIVFLMAGTLLTSAVTIVPAVYAEGDDGKDRHDDKNGDGVKQKAKAKNNCRTNEAEDNERAGISQDQTGGGPTDCTAISANVNDFELIVPGGGPVLMDSIGTNLEE
jgi:hypothetical protein